MRFAKKIGKLIFKNKRIVRLVESYSSKVIPQRYPSLKNLKEAEEKLRRDVENNAASDHFNLIVIIENLWHYNQLEASAELLQIISTLEIDDKLSLKFSKVLYKSIDPTTFANYASVILKTKVQSLFYLNLGIYLLSELIGDSKGDSVDIPNGFIHFVRSKHPSSEILREFIRKNEKRVPGNTLSYRYINPVILRLDVEFFIQYRSNNFHQAICFLKNLWHFSNYKESIVLLRYLAISKIHEKDFSDYLAVLKPYIKKRELDCILIAIDKTDEPTAEFVFFTYKILEGVAYQPLVHLELFKTVDTYMIKYGLEKTSIEGYNLNFQKLEDLFSRLMPHNLENQDKYSSVASSLEEAALKWNNNLFSLPLFSNFILSLDKYNGILHEKCDRNGPLNNFILNLISYLDESWTAEVSTSNCRLATKYLEVLTISGSIRQLEDFYAKVEKKIESASIEESAPFIEVIFKHFFSQNDSRYVKYLIQAIEKYDVCQSFRSIVYKYALFHGRRDLLSLKYFDNHRLLINDNMQLFFGIVDSDSYEHKGTSILRDNFFASFKKISKSLPRQEVKITHIVLKDKILPEICLSGEEKSNRWLAIYSENAQISKYFDSKVETALCISGLSVAYQKNVTLSILEAETSSIVFLLIPAYLYDLAQHSRIDSLVACALTKYKAYEVFDFVKPSLICDFVLSQNMFAESFGDQFAFFDSLKGFDSLSEFGHKTLVYRGQDVQVIREVSKYNFRIVWDLGTLNYETFVEMSEYDLREMVSYFDAIVNASSRAVAEFLDRKVALGRSEFAPSICKSPNVLVCAGAGIGNVVLTTPVISKLCEELGCQVDVLLTSPVRGAYELFANSDKINVATFDPIVFARKKYDYIYVTSSFSTEIPPLQYKKLVFCRQKYSFGHLTVNMHEARYNLLGIKDILPGVEVGSEDYKRTFVGLKTSDKKKSVGVIGIAAPAKSGVWSNRQWNNFRELASFLTFQGKRVASFGVQNEYVEGTIDYTGTSLHESIYNLSQCSYFVTTDNGLFHVAEALRVPLTVLFGPTNHTKNGPISQKSKLLSIGLGCSPCISKPAFYRCNDNQCMKNISVDLVLKYMSKEGIGDSKIGAFSQEFESSFGKEYYRLFSQLLPNAKLFGYRFIKHLVKHSEPTFLSDLIMSDDPDFSNEIYRKALRVGLSPTRKQFLDARNDLLRTDVTKLSDLEILAVLDSFASTKCWEEIGNFFLDHPHFKADQNKIKYLIDYKIENQELNEAKLLLENVKDLRSNRALRKRWRAVSKNILQDLSSCSPVLYSNAAVKIAIVGELETTFLLDYKHIVGIYLYDDLNTNFWDSSHHFDWVIHNCKGSDRKLLGQFCSGKLVDFAQKSEIDDLLLFLFERLRSAQSKPKRRCLLIAHHHLTKWAPHGGEHSSKYIVEYLQDQQWDVLVLVSNRKNDLIFCEIDEGIRYVVTSFMTLHRDLDSVIRSYMPDVAMTYGPPALIAGPILTRHKIPFLNFIRFWDTMSFPPYDSLNLLASEEENNYFGPSIQNAYRVIGNSKFVSKMIHKKYQIDATTVYVPVDPPPASFSIDKSRLEYITLINPKKEGGQYLLRYLATIFKKEKFLCIGIPSIEMPSNVVITDYSYKPYYEALIETKILLFPYFSAPPGTGRVPIEAYHCGIPVITSDQESIKEVVFSEHCVTNYQSYENWKLVLQNVLENFKDIDRQKLMKRALNDFCPKAQSRIVDEILRESLEVPK